MSEPGAGAYLLRLKLLVCGLILCATIWTLCGRTQLQEYIESNRAHTSEVFHDSTSTLSSISGLLVRRSINLRRMSSADTCEVAQAGALPLGGPVVWTSPSLEPDSGSALTVRRAVVRRVLSRVGRGLEGGDGSGVGGSTSSGF
jgi:hypothetical protein